MTITRVDNPGDGPNALFTGSHFDDAGSPAAAVFTPGFRPRYVRVDNVTDRTKWEWYAGMAAADNVQTVAAGTVTLITSAGVSVTSAQGSAGSFTFAVAQNKQYRIQAMS